MPQIHIIAVGKLREPHWKAAAEAYVKRLRHGYDLVETIVKDGDASLPPPERSALEGERILQALAAGNRGSVLPICLDEGGDMTASVPFARFLRKCFDAGNAPCFIIGGAYGLSGAVRDRAAKVLSLGPMTFPHELARVLLLEQLFRADAIMRNKPYHHG